MFILFEPLPNNCGNKNISIYICMLLFPLQSSGSSSNVQPGSDRIGGGGGSVALSSAAEDEPGVRRDDLVAPGQISEGGEDDSESRILVQPFTDDKNRDKNKDTSESEGGKNFSYYAYFILFHNSHTLLSQTS
jgi:hypothetical protein